jgi:hypothetical protein
MSLRLSNGSGHTEIAAYFPSTGDFGYRPSDSSSRSACWSDGRN